MKHFRGAATLFGAGEHKHLFTPVHHMTRRNKGTVSIISEGGAGSIALLGFNIDHNRARAWGKGLISLWGDALDNIFVVGLSGTIGQFDGRRWTLTPARARSDLLAVTGGEAGVFAVGAGGAALRHRGRVWQSDVTGFDGGLRAVSAGDVSGVMAAGDAGTILRRSPEDLG